MSHDEKSAEDGKPATRWRRGMYARIIAETGHPYPCYVLSARGKNIKIAVWGDGFRKMIVRREDLTVIFEQEFLNWLVHYVVELPRVRKYIAEQQQKQRRRRWQRGED